MTATMRPFFSFYGAKFRQALRLPPPEYGTIVEPFAGSLGYSVRHGAGRRVLGVERDPTIVGVWQWLLQATKDDVLDLPLLEADSDVRLLPIDQGARDLVGFWVNKGMTSPCHRPSKWMREYAETKPETFWGAPVRARLAAQLPLISSWLVTEGDYSNAPDIEATWFIDPPYTAAGRRYRYGSRGIDYTALGEWCRTRRGQVIVCEQASADWLPFEPVPYAVKAAAGAGGRYSPEVMWTNARSEVDSYGQGELLG